MNWETLGLTFAFMVIGYLIGSINNAVLLTKLAGLEDPRKKGSGNAGATNTTRNYGIKIGATVFLLDILKPIIAMIIPFFALAHNQVLVPVVGLATIIGHIWPVFFGFRGGKGAASMLGFMIFVSWMLALIGAVLFIILVWRTRKVSLGSIVVPFVIIIIYVVFAYAVNLRDAWIEPATRFWDWWIVFIAFFLIWALVVIKHKDNIQRLIKGTERSFSLKK